MPYLFFLVRSKLHVVLEDPETKQTLVSGMGESICIVLDRVKHQFKLAEATLGRARSLP